MSDTKRTIVQVRLSGADKARVEAAAARDRRTVSAWLRALVLDALDDEETTARLRARRPPKTKD